MGSMINNPANCEAVIQLTKHNRPSTDEILPIFKPLPIMKYNAFMKGVDKADQKMPYYSSKYETLR